ncbi:MAG: DNA polymerase III subunit delta [Treponema sp.]|jgi:DNA polymerase-3 subunit delta|nr:DNA polymerase III subunit delta [Treponema sp.]
MAKKSGAWLFLGPEIGEKQTAIDEIKKKLSESGGFEEIVYYAGETPVPTMVSHIRNASLFADSRFFLIKCVEGIKKKDDIDLLSSCLASLPDDTFAVLISEETSAAKGLENAIPPSNKRVFWELTDNRKAAWVEAFFTGEGFKIGNEGVETILELVENNTAALKQECSRLTLFLDKNREITGEEAEKWLSHTREESAFTLFTRIAAGDFSRSLESARMLLAAKEAPPAIFAALASCFRKLGGYLSLKESGVNDDWEYRKIGVSSPGAKRDYAAAAKRYDSTGAETCLALTTEYDMRLRASSSFPEQILMDEYLFKIHSLARASA